jgi:hypothetical protein
MKAASTASACRLSTNGPLKEPGPLDEMSAQGLHAHERDRRAKRSAGPGSGREVGGSNPPGAITAETRGFGDPGSR